MLTDPRVLTFYDAWRVARAPADREFEVLVAEYPQTVGAFTDAWLAEDHASTAVVVRTWLHRLPAAWTDMVTANLLRAFRTAHYHGRPALTHRRPPRPPTRRSLVSACSSTAAHPRGRVPDDPYAVHAASGASIGSTCRRSPTRSGNWRANMRRGRSGKTRRRVFET